MIGYEKHVLVCMNERSEGHPRGSCSMRGSEAVLHAFKDALAARGLKATCRANSSGCLDYCGQGPTVVVYPDAVWYGRVAVTDVEEIIASHLVGGRPVERLRIPDVTQRG